MRRSRPAHVIAAAAVATTMFASSFAGSASPSGTAAPADWVDPSRASVPEDRYAMAGGCYSIRWLDGRYVLRSGATFAATGTSSSDAEPFFFRFRSMRARSARVGVAMPEACASLIKKA